MSPVTVKIFGDEYHIRSKDDPEYVQRVADYLDARMREVAGDGIPPLPLSKVAILAALNIADELLRLKELGQAESDRVNRVLDDLIKTMDQALGS
jgi:cell division protein ZapA